jgi:hypothetical protein
MIIEQVNNMIYFISIIDNYNIVRFDDLDINIYLQMF